MNPWHGSSYPGAPNTGEGGGVEDLQTDVMRFMAMLGLCLVAIFALVQSLPVAPTPVVAAELATAPLAAVARPEPAQPPPPLPSAPSEPEPAPPAPLPVAEALVPATEASSPPPATVITPEPKADTEGEPLPVPKMADRRSPTPALRSRVPAPIAPPSAAPTPPAPAAVEPTPVAPPAASAPAPSPPPVAAPPAPPRTPEFTLRFVDSAALLALVERGAVGLFAVDGQGTSQLGGRAGRYAFAGVQAPRQMHDMDPASVPAQVRAAYARSRGLSAAGVRRWGVVLPPHTRQAIERLLHDPRGGELQIGANGEVTLLPEGPPMAFEPFTSLAGAFS